MTGRLHFDYAPGKQGLYDPAFEKDACGVGFIADMTGAQTHATVKDATLILTHLTHRGETKRLIRIDQAPDLSESNMCTALNLADPERIADTRVYLIVPVGQRIFRYPLRLGRSRAEHGKQAGPDVMLLK